MAHPAIIEHLTKLGITTVELMPIQQFTNDTTLQAKGLSNYWGYNTIGYFAHITVTRPQTIPARRFLSSRQW